MPTNLLPRPDPISHHDKATKIILAIQESDTVLLRHCFPDNNTQTYQIDPQQDLHEDTDAICFQDEEYGSETVTRAQLNQATIVGHQIILPLESNLSERTILCYEWRPHPIDNQN